MGRKSKFKQEYIQLIEQHLKSGYSYTSFASRLNIHIDTLYEWEKRFPEFSEAKKVGLMHAQSFWEDIGRDMAINGNFNAWKFNMKNRFGWRDTPPEGIHVPQEVEILKKPKLIIQLDEDDMSL